MTTPTCPNAAALMGAAAVDAHLRRQVGDAFAPAFEPGLREVVNLTFPPLNNRKVDFMGFAIASRRLVR